MPLTNKYLKYRPEITLEIFTLVWNKLVELDIPGKIYDYYEDKSLEQFKEKGYIWIGPYSSYSFGIDNNRGKLIFTETTVQEILGYDPFVNKEVIPEYVECISWVGGLFTSSKIYKVVNGKVKDNDGDHKITNWNHGCFRPSSKSAFDAQNQPKQPLKQAVHCKTQEEWDFVQEKLGNDSENWFKDPNWGDNKSFCVSFEGKNQSQTLYFYQNAGYQILSFQEWCDLNGYKMEKEVKFEVGKWYKIKENEFIKFSRIENCIDYNKVHYSEIIDKIFIKENDYIASKSLEKYALNNPVSIEEIQQYLPDGHPDKIKVDREFKVGDWVYHRDSKVFQIAHIKKDFDQVQATNLKIFGINSIRHATPEEINNHLISIGQMPSYLVRDRSTDDLSNYGLPTEPPSYTYEMELEHFVSKTKMILSIDDEELPMVDIIKTSSIKLLLNNN